MAAEVTSFSNWRLSPGNETNYSVYTVASFGIDFGEYFVSKDSSSPISTLKICIEGAENLGVGSKLLASFKILPKLYCEVKVGKKIVHHTEIVEKKGEAVEWKSNFSLDIMPRQLIDNELVTFTIKTKKGPLGDKIVGATTIPLIDILPSGTLTALPLHSGKKSPKSKHWHQNNSASSVALAAGHVDKAKALARAGNTDAPLLLVKLAMEAKLTENNCFNTKKLGLFSRQTDGGEFEFVELFAFPNGARLVTLNPEDKVPTPVYHMFVLTDQNGSYMYAHCYTWHETCDEHMLEFFPPWPSVKVMEPRCVCVVSPAPAHAVIKTALLQTAASMKLGLDSRKRTDRHLRKEHLPELYEYCDLALKKYQKEVAAQIDARAKLNVKKADGAAPARMNARTMPPTNVDFSSFFRLEPHLVLLVYNALICQMSVIVKSQNKSLLATTLEALLCLLCPLQWNGVYIPCLPINEQFVTILAAPVPYIVGVTKRDMDRVGDEEVEEILAREDIAEGVVQLDLDTSKLTPFILPTPALPPKTFSELLHVMLSCKMGSEHKDIPLSKLNTPQAINKIRWAFVSALADMLRGFKDHLIAVGDNDTELQVGSFVAKRTDVDSHFLTTVMNTQMIQTLCESVLARGKLPNDAFVELCMKGPASEKDPKETETDTQKLLSQNFVPRAARSKSSFRRKTLSFTQMFNKRTSPPISKKIKSQKTICFNSVDRQHFVSASSFDSASLTFSTLHRRPSQARTRLSRSASVGAEVLLKGGRRFTMSGFSRRQPSPLLGHSAEKVIKRSEAAVSALAGPPLSRSRQVSAIPTTVAEAKEDEEEFPPAPP